MLALLAIALYLTEFFDLPEGLVRVLEGRVTLEDYSTALLSEASIGRLHDTGEGCGARKNSMSRKSRKFGTEKVEILALISEAGRVIGRFRPRMTRPPKQLHIIPNLLCLIPNLNIRPSTFPRFVYTTQHVTMHNEP